MLYGQVVEGIRCDTKVKESPLNTTCELNPRKTMCNVQLMCIIYISCNNNGASTFFFFNILLFKALPLHSPYLVCTFKGPVYKI